MFRSARVFTLLVFFLGLFLTACGDSPTPAPAAVVEVTRIVEVTKIVEVTRMVAAPTTSAPSATPTLSATLAPTNTAAAPKTTIPPTAAVAAANNKGKVGDTLTVNGYKLTLAAVEKADSYGDFTKAKAGNTLVAVDLTIASELDKGISVNPFYASIKDGQGFKYTATIGAKQPQLTSQNDLPKGDKVRGWLTFEVPKTAKGLLLEYKPTDFVNNTVINFALE